MQVLEKPASVNPTERPLQGGRFAVKVSFVVLGLIWGTWAPHIALVQERLDLSPGVLGLVLLSAACGTLVIMPIVGALAGHFGSGPLTRLFAPAAGLVLLLPALAPNLGLLILGAVILGATSGALDIAMNTHAIALETHVKRPIISTFHAFYSLAGLIGAGGAAILLPIVGAQLHIVIVTALLLVLGAIVSRCPLPGERDKGIGRRMFALPPRAVLGIGLLAFVGLVGEGAVQDWSAVYLFDNLGTGEGTAALGFAAFSATMALGRFTGDWLRVRFSDTRLLVVSAVTTTLGLCISLLSAAPATAIIGFGVMGLGLANIVPLLFIAGTRVPAVAPSVGLAAVATVGYAGLMLGPVAIGGVAEFIGLRGALGLLALAVLGIALAAPRLMPPKLAP